MAPWLGPEWRSKPGAFHLAFRAQGTDDSRDTLKEPWGVVSEWPVARESRVHQASWGEV